MGEKGIAASLVVVILIVIAAIGVGTYFLITQIGAPEGVENQPGGGTTPSPTTTPSGTTPGPTTTTTPTPSSTTPSPTTTPTTTTTPSGPEPQGGLPPIFSGDERENAEALFNSYNGEVPKTVFESFLQQLGESQLAGAMGPALHHIGLGYTYTSDGSALDYVQIDDNILPNASVPDAVMAPDGVTIRLYFVDAHPTRKIITAVDTLSGDKVTSADLWSLYNAGYVQTNNLFSTARSTDGENFTVEALAIKNLPEDVLLADPSVVLLENGSYRLYFLCVLASTCSGGDPASSNHHRIASAISSDGLNFVYEGINYDEGVQPTGGGLSDPEVYKTGDYYRLYIHAGGGRANNKILTSYDDGCTFDNASAVDLFGSYSTAGTGLRICETPGGYRMYFGENMMTYSATLDTNGEIWTMRDEPKIGGRGSMAPIRIPEGSPLPWKYLLYFHA